MSVAATPVLASVTSNAGVESGEFNPTLEAPEPNAQNVKSVLEETKIIASRVDQSDPGRRWISTQTSVQGAGIQDIDVTEDAAAKVDKITVAAREKTADNNSGEDVDENGFTKAESS